MSLKRKLKETLIYFTPQSKHQWGSLIAVVMLLAFSCAYVLMSLPNIPKDIKSQMNTDNLYLSGIVIETNADVCDEAVENTPVTIDEVPSTWNCLKTYVKIPGYGNHELQAPYGMTLDDLKPGTKIVAVNYDNGTSNDWYFSSIDRSYTIIFVIAFCFITIILVVGVKGIRAIFGIGLSIIAIMYYLVPSLLSGNPPILTTLSISILMLGLIMYLTHGIKWMTTTAFLGTSLGIGIIVFIGWIFDLLAKSSTSLPTDLLELMSFIPQSETATLSTLSNIYFASLILVSVGILNDIMIAQASTVWQLRLSNMKMTVKELFFKGMSVGQDHASSAMYTLVFVYASTALPLILSAYMYTDMSWKALFASDFGIEILKTSVSIIGLMVTIPLTTLLASIMSSHVSKKSLEKGTTRHKH